MTIEIFGKILMYIGAVIIVVNIIDLVCPDTTTYLIVCLSTTTFLMVVGL